MILDAGSGTGNYAFELYKDVKKVVTLEVSEGMIAV